jgi:hypothetical protein
VPRLPRANRGRARAVLITPLSGPSTPLAVGHRGVGTTKTQRSPPASPPRHSGKRRAAGRNHQTKAIRHRYRLVQTWYRLSAVSMARTGRGRYLETAIGTRQRGFRFERCIGIAIPKLNVEGSNPFTRFESKRLGPTHLRP